MEYQRNASALAAAFDVARAVLTSIRPKQWTKNLLVYLALFFTVNEAWDASDFSALFSHFGKATLAFIIFLALSGAVYLVNDIFDADKDRQHPKKRNRPIASGRLSVALARVVAGILAAVGIGAAFVLEPLFGIVAASYLATMAVYTSALKQVIVLDVFAISTGFVLRAVAGAAVLQVPISPWLYICTGLGALFIALGKRRSELSLAGERAPSQRGTLERYTTSVLDQFIVVVATCVILAYSLYTFPASNLPGNHTMMLTIPFVAYGLFRYMFLVHVKDMGESPEELLISDAPLVAAIILWLATAATILVVFRG
jgi:4-hydroxybenzoate polyprenyltransferase